MKMRYLLVGFILCSTLLFSDALAADKTDEIITRHIEELAIGKGDPNVLPRHDSVHLLTPKQITEFHARLKETVDGWTRPELSSWGDGMGGIQFTIMLGMLQNHFAAAPQFVYSLKYAEGLMKAVGDTIAVIAAAPAVISDPDVRARWEKLKVLGEEWNPHAGSLRKIYLKAARDYWKSPTFKKRRQTWSAKKSAALSPEGFIPKFGDKPLTTEEWELYKGAREIYEVGVKSREDHRKFFATRRYIKEALVDDARVTRAVKKPAGFHVPFIMTKEEGNALLMRTLKEGMKGLK